MSQHHVLSVRTYFVIFGILMGLLFATVGCAYMPLGGLHFATAMVIAVVKALIIMLWFMHVKFSSRLTWIFAFGSFFWLVILILLGLMDYQSRGWPNILGK